MFRDIPLRRDEQVRVSSNLMLGLCVLLSKRNKKARTTSAQHGASRKIVERIAPSELEVQPEEFAAALDCSVRLAG